MCMTCSSDVVQYTLVCARAMGHTGCRLTDVTGSVHKTIVQRRRDTNIYKFIML